MKKKKLKEHTMRLICLIKTVVPCMLLRVLFHTKRVLKTYNLHSPLASTLYGLQASKITEKFDFQFFSRLLPNSYSNKCLMTVYSLCMQRKLYL